HVWRRSGGDEGRRFDRLRLRQNCRRGKRAEKRQARRLEHRRRKSKSFRLSNAKVSISATAARRDSRSPVAQECKKAAAYLSRARGNVCHRSIPPMPATRRGCVKSRLKLNRNT